jgi:hypothetical protein
MTKMTGKAMKYRINVTGKSMNEVYGIVFPDNLLRFIRYDFTAFSEKCVELCRASMKLGAVNRDEVSNLRSTIVACHKYFEKNLHGIFEKIVLDHWIEYICRQNEISFSTLWSSFMPCRNNFEKVLFARLCEYRYNSAINQWVNLLKIQDYAIKKVDFIFGKKLDNRGVAVAKAGYFDLLFNVAANEMGYGELSANKVYSGLRTPNSPFVMSGISREIMRNVLSGVNFEDGEEIGAELGVNRKEYTSDKAAMEAFSVIRSIIPEEPDSIINTIMKSISHTPQRVYIPESFKAVIDLEIDALLESGAVVQKCGRCLEYYLKDENYNHDYCSRIEGGRTCLGIMDDKMSALKESAKGQVDPAVLHSRCEQLYKEMAERVNVDINQRDFSDWYKYMALIRENVISGSADMDDFENFVEYSRSISFISTARKYAKQRKIEIKPIATDESGREVHAFEFEKIERTPGVRKAAPVAELPANLEPQQSVPVIPLALNVHTDTPTMRVIRGVEPQGVSVIGVNEPELVAEDELIDEIPDIEVIEGIAENDAPDAPSEENADDDHGVSQDADEFVKVYQRSPEPWRPRIPQITKPGKTGKPAKHEKYDKGSLLLNPYIRDIISIEENDEPAPAPKKAEKAEAPKLRLPEPKTASNPPSEPPKLDFDSILSGIQRADGFDSPKSAVNNSNNNSQDEEMPVSHKTQRVMDAIFGKTKTVNPFIKQGKDKEENHD